MNGSVIIYADSPSIDFNLMRLAMDFCKKVGSTYLPIFVSYLSGYDFENLLINTDIPHGNYLLINPTQAICELTRRRKLPEFQNVIAIFHTTQE